MTTAPPPTPSRVWRQTLKWTVQLAGFVVSVSIVLWLVSVATSGEQAEALKQLREISTPQVVVLIGLSVTTLVLNGVLFWVASRPARWSRRVTLAGVLATNAVATMLAYLPFKVSAAVRAGIHLRRDGLTVAQLFAWWGCFFAAMGGTIGPMALASVWRGEMDTLWWLACGLGMTACYLGSLMMARWLANDRGHRWLAVSAGAGPWRRVLTPVRVEELHESFAIIGHARWLLAAYAIRVVDMLVQAMRFRSASEALGEGMSLSDGVVVATGYFAMLVLSPFGALGAREAGAVGAGAIVGSGGPAGASVEAAVEKLAATTLLVTGAEVVTLLALGLISLAWLGPGLLRGATGKGKPAADEAERASEGREL